MRVLYDEVGSWPPLAWLAVCSSAAGEARVYHGSQVETAETWFCEAVWAGDFAAGDFDLTDIVAGSGGRLRGGEIAFVSSGSTVDRLHSLRRPDGVWVSNSLPCLLAAAGGEVDPSYPRYFADFFTVIHGLGRYKTSLHTSAGSVSLTYFDNLVWNGRDLAARSKPGGHAAFSSFEEYRDFLDRSMRMIARNARDHRRRSPYRLLGTLSSGYDSATVTMLGAEAGLTEVITFDQGVGAHEVRSRAFPGTGADSGDAVARHLGVQTLRVGRGAWQGVELPEVPFIAADSFGEETHFKGAEPLLSRRVLLTGYHGDRVWGKDVEDTSEHVVRRGLSGLALTEYRLWAGFVHCPIPFWGARHIRDLARISRSAEMAPWDVPGAYSRPICRRLLEEAGVPREAFGTHKRAASVWLHNSREFLTPTSFEQYMGWLAQRRGEWLRRRRVPPIPSVDLDRALTFGARALERWTTRTTWWAAETTGAAWLVNQPCLRRLATVTHPDTPFAPWIPPLRRFVFPWAVELAKTRYRALHAGQAREAEAVACFA